MASTNNTTTFSDCRVAKALELIKGKAISFGSCNNERSHHPLKGRNLAHLTIQCRLTLRLSMILRLSQENVDKGWVAAARVSLFLCLAGRLE